MCALASSPSAFWPESRGRTVTELSLLDQGNVRDGDEVEFRAALVVDERLIVLRDQAMLGLFNPDHVAVVQAESVRLKWPTIVDVQECLARHNEVCPELHPLSRDPIEEGISTFSQ
jgi:hypothetical protein